MNHATMLALFLTSTEAPSGPGPSAAPHSPSTYCYGGGLVGVQWTNGDSTASTQILKSGVVVATRPPGATGYGTDHSAFEYNLHTWTARHVKNAQTSDSIAFPGAPTGCGGAT